MWSQPLCCASTGIPTAADNAAFQCIVDLPPVVVFFGASPAVLMVVLTEFFRLLGTFRGGDSLRTLRNSAKSFWEHMRASQPLDHALVLLLSAALDQLSQPAVYGHWFLIQQSRVLPLGADVMVSLLLLVLHLKTYYLRRAEASLVPL